MILDKPSSSECEMGNLGPIKYSLGIQNIDFLPETNFFNFIPIATPIDQIVR